MGLSLSSWVGAGALALAAFAGAASPAAAEPAQPGLPQLDFSYWPGHILWTLVVFAILYVALERLLLPKIAGPIAQRKARIEADLAGSEKLKAEIEAARARAQAALNEARVDAAKAAQKATAEIAAQAQARRDAAQGELASRIAAAEARIENARAAALSALDTEIAPLAGAIVARLGVAGVTDADLAKTLSALRAGSKGSRG